MLKIYFILTTILVLDLIIVRLCVHLIELPHLFELSYKHIRKYKNS